LLPPHGGGGHHTDAEESTVQPLSSTLQAFCDQAELLRLAFLDRQGRPRVVPVWFVRLDEAYYIGIGATSERARVYRALGEKYFGAADHPDFVETFGHVDDADTVYVRLVPEDGLTWEY
jgi:hypothetical protein